MIAMTPEVRAIAQRLADAIAEHKAEGASKIAPRRPLFSTHPRLDKTVICFPLPSAPATEKPADSVQSPRPTNFLVAVPLSPSERAFAAAQSELLRNFIIARGYAIKRAKARREIAGLE